MTDGRAVRFEPDDLPAGSVVPWRWFLEQTERVLADGGAPSPASESRWLVEEVSGHRGGDLVTHLDRPAERLAVTHLEHMVERRLAGEPLQYVLGSWSFRRLDLFVDHRVLIPRPETEVVVDHALESLDRRRSEVTDRPLVAADLGTGSGAIALSLVFERPWVEVVASDASPDALDVARSNLAGIGRPAARVTLVRGSWFDALATRLRGGLDLVVSNPPYVAASDELPDEVASWEPPGALVSGPSGTESLEAIITCTRGWLAPGGSLVLELAPHQATAMRDLALRSGFSDCEIHPDHTGRDRVLVAVR
jgi:release factor glutamine methyltransferase